MTLASQNRIQPLEPAWVRYLSERLPGETPHPDDDFFRSNTTGNYTATVPTGSLAASISGGRLALDVDEQVSQDVCGYTKPVGSLSAPVTLETRVNLIQQAGNVFGGLCFANGTANSSSVIFNAFYVQGGAVNWAVWSDTFESIGTASVNLSLGPSSKDVYLRFCWKSANTFRAAIALSEGVWLAFGTGDIADTQTPTRMGFLASTYTTSGLGALALFDYLRVYNADMVTGIAT